MPRVIHFCGHMTDRAGGQQRWAGLDPAELAERIVAILAEEEVAAGVGALASGADLLIAEALLARGARLEVVLPFAVEDFIAQSVVPSGSDWCERFERALCAADRVLLATPQVFDGDDALYAWGTRMAIGRALLLAHGEGEALQLAVWDGQTGSGPAGTGADVAAWRATGRRQRLIALGTEHFAELPAQPEILGGERRPLAYLLLPAGLPLPSDALAATQESPRVIALPDPLALLPLVARTPGAALHVAPVRRDGPALVAAELGCLYSLREAQGSEAPGLATEQAAAYIAAMGQEQALGRERPHAGKGARAYEVVSETGEGSPWSRS